jgi:hypothetical protein
MRSIRFGFNTGIAALVALACSAAPEGEAVGTTEESIVRGTVETGRREVVLLSIDYWDGAKTRCSGTYFAPRVVLTAAHCLKDRPTSGVRRVFVYHGSNYAADSASLPNVPAPGEPSVWARADSWQSHPDYVPELHHPDLAVVYLDRRLPFDPLPLFRERVGSEWIGTQADVVGWGGDRALTADISRVEGGGVKRSGRMTLLGTPTLTDYHADDPNPGLFDATIRSHLLKLDGSAPQPNSCAGDSGGPSILRRWGQDYVAGVSMWTGLWCEDYSIHTRLDAFLPFLDEAYRRGGQATVRPEVRCVEEQSDGSFLAHFGYQNDNGVAVTVPYSWRNGLAQDTTGARPTRLLPGHQRWAFAVPFKAGDQAVWRLTAENSGSAEARASGTSPRCSSAADVCARSCYAAARAECGFAGPSLYSTTECTETCLDFRSFFPTCEGQWDALSECGARTAPAAENWNCDAEYNYAWTAACPHEDAAFMSCLESG